MKIVYSIATNIYPRRFSNYAWWFVCGVCFLTVIFFLTPGAFASTNISSATTEHWAWNDLIGWINFYITDSVTVTNSKIKGYASSSAGYISFDCSSEPPGGSGCGGGRKYQVSKDGAGNLSGWAWNDQYGWISFWCGNVTSSDCQKSNYQVWIDANGVFNNYAWNDVIGWISFNCLNHGCGTPYSVITSLTATPISGYLDSTTFDTGVASGSQLNSVLWYGDQPTGTSVRFQFATSNASSGPWKSKDFVGHDGTSDTYYSAWQNVSMILGYTPHNNARYFRYRVTLFSDASQILSPRIYDIIVNWSP